jgi:hypothetical protein
MPYNQIGLPQINLIDYQVPLDRDVELGLGRLEVYDEDDNLVASVPALDESITLK